MYLNKDLIVECLKELSDKKDQERLWLASSGPEISSFDEAMCQLFDDSGLKDALNKEEAFGEEVDVLLKRLRSILRMINPYRPPQEIIDDPRMEDVRSTSAEILDLIRHTK